MRTKKRNKTKGNSKRERKKAKGYNDDSKRIKNKTERTKRNRIKKYKKNKRKLKNLKKKLEKKKKENKQALDALKTSLTSEGYDIDKLNIMRLTLISHLKLPIDILSRITKSIEETEEEEFKENDKHITSKLNDIKKIIDAINNMSYPELFDDDLSQHSKKTFAELDVLTKKISEEQISIRKETSRNIIEIYFNLIQELFDEIYEITNDLLVDENNFYYELADLTDLLESIGRLTKSDPTEMQVKIRIDR